MKITILNKTRQPALIFPTPHFGRMRTQGAMTPIFEVGGDFCTMHLPQVSSSCVYSFGSYRVDKQINQSINQSINNYFNVRSKADK